MDKKTNRKSTKESEKNNFVRGYGERIKVAVKNVNGASELSRMIDIPRNSLQRYITEETEPSISIMVRISRATDTNLQWLATGEGLQEGHMNANQASVDAVSLDIVENASAALYGYLEKKKRYLKPDEFGEAVVILCGLAPEDGDIDISLVERLMKFKGK